jgi:hypothetical protein
VRLSGSWSCDHRSFAWSLSHFRVVLTAFAFCLTSIPPLTPTHTQTHRAHEPHTHGRRSKRLYRCMSSLRFCPLVLGDWLALRSPVCLSIFAPTSPFPSPSSADYFATSQRAAPRAAPTPSAPPSQRACSTQPGTRARSRRRASGAWLLCRAGRSELVRHWLLRASKGGYRWV